MKNAALPLLRVLLAAAGAATLASCAALQAVTEAGAGVAAAAGVITPDQAGAVTRSSAAIFKAAEVLTPENEYYIGRAVGANILLSYKPLDHTRATRYLNTLGQTLALVSEMPQTFGGYRFLILDTDEVNAFAAPGGHIFISRGMLRCCKNESALAAVLAHEIGHIQHQHGLASIQQGRITQAGVTVLAEGARSMGGENLKMLTDQFQGAVGDIAKTLIVNGYSRGAEKEADTAAIAILKNLGYNPTALLDMLAEMETRVKPGGAGFGKTHPPPADRIQSIRALAEGAGPVVENEAIRARFAEAMRGVL